MSTHLGVLRDEAGLETAVEATIPSRRWQTSDMALVALMIATGRFTPQGKPRQPRANGLSAGNRFAPDTHRQTLTLRDVVNDTPSAPAAMPRAAAGA